MATAAKKSEGISPLGLLVAILGFAIVYAMAQNGGLDIDLSKPKGGTSTPCPPDEKPGKVVRGFTARGLGRVELRCGTGSRGWRHINQRHPPANTRMLNCIKRVLATVADPQKKELEWVYRLRFRGGDYATVRVDPRTKTVNSAYTKGKPRTPKSARWDDCVAGRIR